MALPNPLIQLDPACMPEPHPNGARKRRLVRRRDRDRSQALRRTVQVVFLLLNLALGVQFFLFVRSFEGAQSLPTVTRPPGVEGWLPIAGLMQFAVVVADRRECGYGRRACWMWASKAMTSNESP
jgi:hypothetical protein